MKINLVIFLVSEKGKKEDNRMEIVTKIFESTFRPVIGDIIDDPGFDSKFHNGYEVVKVTVNYDTNECYVSLRPLALEIEEISMDDYIKKLVANKWYISSKEELISK